MTLTQDRRDGDVELISVRVAGQMFAMDIMKVREIRGWTTSTPLPHAPGYVLGMINLRGAVLPVLDLAGRLGLTASEPSPSSVVIVVELGGRPVGLLVDAVCDIITLGQDRVQATPELGADVRRFVQGVVTTDEGIVTLLALEDVLPEADLPSLPAAA